MALPLIFFFVLALLWWYIFLPRQVQRLFSQQKELQLPFEIEIGDAGLLFVNELGRTNRPWNMFVKWKENETLLMLYLSDVLFLLLPKRLLTSPEQAEVIKEHLRKNSIPDATRRGNSIRSVIIVVALLLVITTLLWLVRSATLYR